MLNFDVLYMVECIISFNYLHDYNLNNEFFFLLHKLPPQSAVHILERIYENKKRIYNPISYLRSEFKRLKDVKIKPNHIPDYCTMMRKIIVTPTTMYMLPPNIETSNRVIRHFKDKKDNFLRVHFSDEASNKIGASSGDINEKHSLALYNRIFHTLNDGIKIGDTHYEFLAFSSSQLRDHSCWFFASTKDLTADDIRIWMGNFTDKTVAKYAARMGQCFSSTRAIQRLPVHDIKEIPDIERNGYVFSDGIGKISHLLARNIASKLELKYIPSAFQFRMAGYKGMLCQDSSLQGNQVKVRNSQRKFDSTHTELEVIRCSAYIPSYLNRQAITLLSSLGIPDNIFIRMKDEQVDQLNKILENESTAISVLQHNIDEYGTSKSLAEYVKAGFLQKNDPYLINLISLFRITMLRDIKKKAKIRVNKGAFLLGVLDETKSLKENEVYCCTSDPCNPSSRKWITGTCIVYRNPCFHPGDVRIVKAVKCDALKDLVDVLVFPQVGERDIPNQCSGGDLDGDDFTIIYDEHLIPKKIEEPMDYKAQKPEKVEKVTMVDIKKFFVNYVFSDQLGRIANAHLARADRNPEGAKHESCIKLAHLHSDAVDFPKTGIPASFPLNLRVKEFPDFMEKPDKAVYQSKKVLGILYRSIKEEDYKPYVDLNFDKRLYVEGYVKYLEEARMLKKSYDRDVKALMNQFGIMTEFEVTSGYIINTHPIDKKKPRDVVKCVMDAMIPIKKHYRKLFDSEFYYFNGSTIITMEASIQMEQKAFAWYYITYHPSEQSDENMISFPWIVGDILCKIALRNHCNDRKNDFIKSLQPTRQQPSQLTVNQNNFTTNRFDINVNNCSNDLFNLKKLIQIK
ncbi:RdRP-domain-containing protein [Rhizophagus irregularis]|uniref:RNA-dependent RNA polymerase n=1 Tax=Rhizophagus irregularis TaxID=588596 RepID=A0A2I1HBP3_9GLOM|nr:RdRP-domain-containing protein [Rhizophagus irregularis]